MKIVISKKYKAMFPRPDEEQYELMKADIRGVGQHVPIAVNSKGVILDGYTRYQICQELKIKPKIAVMDFKTKHEEMMFIISANLTRRHLTSWQRFRAAKGFIEYVQKENKK